MRLAGSLHSYIHKQYTWTSSVRVHLLRLGYTIINIIAIIYPPELDECCKLTVRHCIRPARIKAAQSLASEAALLVSRNYPRVTHRGQGLPSLLYYVSRGLVRIRGAHRITVDSGRPDGAAASHHDLGIDHHSLFFGESAKVRHSPDEILRRNFESR